MKLPKLRTENIAVQYLKDEVLIYDMLTHKAYCLNETLAIVYDSCDGAATFADLKKKYKFSDDFIFLALDELKRENLIAEDYQSKFKGVSRREVISKVGLASMIALPLVVGMIAPPAAHAASGTVTGCQTDVCYPAGFALCNACPGRPNVQFYDSQNGS